ncbi:reverse transcriptase family protein [Nannocystis pusilla]|uniref:reverse transcriptase family protein n=1 Tax=Nannocystis pusilla TaxID=889268 RepID=UPI003DA67E6A
MANTNRIDYSRMLETWRAVESAGGRDKYIEAQLKEKGYLVERKPTDSMSKAELERYKKSLKEEAAEKRRLAKEAWLAYKASHLVHLGEGVFWNDQLDHDKWDLPGAEERQAENELPKLDKPKELAEALGVSIAELRRLAYHRDAATKLNYYRFEIPKRDGSKRAIWAPHRTLKAAQRWILREVVERLPVHGAAHGFLHGRSTATNAAVHRDSQILLKVDLKDFFPTVTLPRVKGVFRKAGYREQIATLLALLCTEAPRHVADVEGTTYYLSLGPRCLPQGAPTSPAITNTLCLRLDRRLQGLAKKLGWRYTRYADDLTFSLPSDHKGKPRVGGLLGGISIIAAAEGFTVHPDKTRVHRSGGRQQVTGLVVNGKQGPRVTREFKREVRAAVHNLAHGKPLKDGETLSSLAGRIAYIYMTDKKLGKQLLAALDRV